MTTSHQFPSGSPTVEDAFQWFINGYGSDVLRQCCERFLATFIDPPRVDPVFPLSDLDLRMWAVEQAVALSTDGHFGDIIPNAEELIAYVRGSEQ